MTEQRSASLISVFRRLWPQIWLYRVRVGIALVCLVIAKLANIGVPLIMKSLIDKLNLAPKPLLIPLLLLVPACSCVWCSIVCLCPVQFVIEEVQPVQGVRPQDHEIVEPS